MTDGDSADDATEPALAPQLPTIMQLLVHWCQLELARGTVAASRTSVATLYV